LQGRLRKDGATVFLDLATMEPHDDQWAFLSTLSRMSPREVSRLADRSGAVTVGQRVTGLVRSSSSRIRPASSPTVRARLGAGVRVEMDDLAPALLEDARRAIDDWRYWVDRGYQL
jgi:hypothetical protein